MVVEGAQEILALGLIFVVHVVGGLMLVWGMLDDEARGRMWWRRRDDGPDDPPPDPRQPSPPGLTAPLPLPGASPSRVRLRDETPLRDGYPRPPRRREPEREPATR